MKKKSKKILLIGFGCMLFFNFFAKNSLAVPENFDWRDHLDYYEIPERYDNSEEGFVPTSGGIVDVEENGKKTDFLTAMYCDESGRHMAFAWPLGEDGRPTGKPTKGPDHFMDWSETHCTQYDEIKNGSEKPRDGAIYAAEIWGRDKDMQDVKVGGMTVGERVEAIENAGGKIGGGGTDMMIASGGWGWIPEQGFTFPGGTTEKKYTSIVEYIDVIYKLVVYVVGVLGVVMFMIGGFQYLTAAGNTSLTSEAKKTMFAALVGVIIVVSAYLLLRIINVELVELVDPAGGGGGGGGAPQEESGGANQGKKPNTVNIIKGRDPKTQEDENKYGDPDDPTQVDMGGGSDYNLPPQDPNIPQTNM